MQYRSFVLALTLALGCSDTKPDRSGTAQAATPAKSAKQLIAEGAAVVDVRTPDEFSGGHVASATNVPVQELPQRIADIDKLVGGDKAKPVVVYCRTGRRSAAAKQHLEAAGYTNVVNAGGYDDLR